MYEFLGSGERSSARQCHASIRDSYVTTATTRQVRASAVYRFQYAQEFGKRVPRVSWSWIFFELFTMRITTRQRLGLLGYYCDELA